MTTGTDFITTEKDTKYTFDFGKVMMNNHRKNDNIQETNRPATASPNVMAVSLSSDGPHLMKAVATSYIDGTM